MWLRMRQGATHGGCLRVYGWSRHALGLSVSRSLLLRCANPLGWTVMTLRRMKSRIGCVHTLGTARSRWQRGLLLPRRTVLVGHRLMLRHGEAVGGRGSGWSGSQV